MNPSSVEARTGDVQLSKKIFTPPAVDRTLFEILPHVESKQLKHSIFWQPLRANLPLLLPLREPSRELNSQIRSDDRKHAEGRPQFEHACRAATSAMECRQRRILCSSGS